MSKQSVSKTEKKIPKICLFASTDWKQDFEKITLSEKYCDFVKLLFSERKEQKTNKNQNLPSRFAKSLIFFHSNSHR